MAAPTLGDVRAAAARLGPHLPRTPLYPHAGLAELLGTEVLVKHENHLPTGAFKVRGGVNLVSQLSHEERERGLIAASTGNHGQSLAYAGRLFGVRVTICVPEGANPAKVGSIRALGAEIVEHGRDFDEAREHCEHLAAGATVSGTSTRATSRTSSRASERTPSRSSRTSPRSTSSSCRSAVAAAPPVPASSRRRCGRRAR